MTAGCRVLMRMDNIIEYYEWPRVSARDIGGFFVEALIRKGGVFMKKRSNKSFLASAAYLVVALVLCAGVIFYTGNGGTGLTVADITDTMPETGTDEIVAGEEEVPLASAPKVSVKKSTKTTTKTFGTTTTTTTNNAASVGASTAVSSSGFAISKFSDIKGHVDSKVYDAFVNLGFEFKINSALATTGVFSTKNHNIQLKRGQSSYLLHELGHFVSALKGRNGKKIDQSSEFTRIYNEEKSAYVGNNKAYVTQDAAGYFAESFRDYTENPSALKSQRPETYSYISKMVSSLSSSDVKAFRNAYGWYWSINK